ncbi:MAG: tetratricopeptide repeat protein, partial [Pseudonocardiaceae bacterium]
MPDQFLSIQDVLRRRKQVAFVGRSGPLALFRENFDLGPFDERKRFLFNVHGEGGVGKSSLLEQWRELTRERRGAEARIDEHVYGVPEAMASLAAQLGAKMKDFWARYDSYLVRREQLERDPQVPREIWSKVIRTSVKAGLHVSKMIPGAGPVVDLVDSETAAQAVDQMRIFLTRKLRNSQDVRLLLFPVDELTPVFVTEIRKLATERPVVLFFDTFEQTGDFLEEWLLELITGRYGPLPSTTTLVVAGRLPLDSNRWSEYLGLVAPVPLAPFTETESRQFLMSVGVTDEHTIETIISVTGGLPLLVDMLARKQPSSPSDIGDPTGTAVERFLKWEPNQARRAVALAGALPRRIDEDLLAAAIGDDNVSEVFDWLKGQPFISARAGRYQYHEVVRTPMLRLRRGDSVQHWREAHSRLADRYRAWRDELSDKPDWANPAWQDHHAEEAYHRLCANLATLPQVLQDAVAAAKAGPSAARRWAEVIVDAGSDLDSQDIRNCGIRLLNGVGEGAEDCHEFLTVLLQIEVLESAGKARALVERARIHHFSDRDLQAVRDCTLAAGFDPKSAEIYAVRASAYTYLNRFEEAFIDFGQALTLDPTDVWTVSRHANALSMMGRYEEALVDFNQAINLDPKAAWAIGSRGETYRAMGRYEEALVDFNQAINLDPKAAWAIGHRGET